MHETGFPCIDRSATNEWIYPTNYPVRQYQLEICKKALFMNTLVCLPTGLGKTLIAAVVMYNYYRWFPAGKVIFMAPTRPLVIQQLQACCDIMCMPKEDIISLEGSISGERRIALWEQARLIFCTPQTAVNDLLESRINPKQIVCVVIDEAHKATSNYAYTQFIGILSQYSCLFRVLALSATPGANIKRIQQVISNLQISQIELRTEDDKEVEPYVFHKQIEIIPAGEIPNTSSSISQTTLKSMRGMLEPVFSIKEIVDYELQQLSNECLQTLYQHELLAVPTLSTLNRYIFKDILRIVESKAQEYSPHIYNHLLHCIEQLEICIQYQHIYNHDGMDILYQTLLQHDKQNDDNFKRLMNSLSKHLQDSNYFPKYLPKLFTLQHILIQHFTSTMANNSRVLIFAHLRQHVFSVKDILLQLSHSSIRPHEFIGQSSTSVTVSSRGSSGNSKQQGMSQQEQIQVLQDFRSGKFNILIATSIAEEGLDIAEVDLLVFLDSIQSSIRLIQRIGRTGRKKAGRILLISNNCSNSSSLNTLNKPLDSNNSSKVENSMYDTNENADENRLGQVEEEEEEDEFADIADYGANDANPIASRSNTQNVNSSSSKKKGSLNDEEKIVHSYETMKKLQNLLLSRTQTFQFYHERESLLPTSIPTPTLQLQQMSSFITGAKGSSQHRLSVQSGTPKSPSHFPSLLSPIAFSNLPTPSMTPGNNNARPVFIDLSSSSSGKAASIQSNKSIIIDQNVDDLFGFDIVPTDSKHIPAVNTQQMEPPTKRSIKSKLLNINKHTKQVPQPTSESLEKMTKEGSTKDVISSSIAKYFAPPVVDSLTIPASLNPQSSTVHSTSNNNIPSVQPLNGGTVASALSTNSFDKMLKNFELEEPDKSFNFLYDTNQINKVSASSASTTTVGSLIGTPIASVITKSEASSDKSSVKNKFAQKAKRPQDDFFSHLDDESMLSISPISRKSGEQTSALLNETNQLVHDISYQEMNGLSGSVINSQSRNSVSDCGSNKKSIRSRLRCIVRSDRSTHEMNSPKMTAKLPELLAVNPFNESTLSITTPIELSLSAVTAVSEKKSASSMMKGSEAKKKVRIVENDDFFQLDDDSKPFVSRLASPVVHSTESNKICGRPNISVQNSKNFAEFLPLSQNTVKELPNREETKATVDIPPSAPTAVSSNNNNPPPKKMLIQKSSSSKSVQNAQIHLQPYQPPSNISNLKQTLSSNSMKDEANKDGLFQNIAEQPPRSSLPVKSFLGKRTTPEKPPRPQQVVNENLSPNIRQSPLIYKPSISKRENILPLTSIMETVERKQTVPDTTTVLFAENNIQVDDSEVLYEKSRIFNDINSKTSPKRVTNFEKSLPSLIENGQCCICLENGVIRCNDSDDEENEEENHLARCSGKCRSVVHLSCYYGDTIPDKARSNFLCEGCIANATINKANKTICCELCMKTSGLLKRVAATAGNGKRTNQFVHSLCTLFIPELFMDTPTMRCCNLHDLPLERASLFCKLCKSRGGGIVQCAYEDCMNAYHVYCAYSNPMKSSTVPLIIYEALHVTKHHQDTENDEVYYQIYCSEHANRIPSILNKKKATLIASANFLSKSLNNSEANNTVMELYNDGENLINTDEKKKSSMGNRLEYDRIEDLFIPQTKPGKVKNEEHLGNTMNRLRKTSKPHHDNDSQDNGFIDSDIDNHHRFDEQRLKKKKEKLRKNFVQHFFDGEAAHSDREHTDVSEDSYGKSTKRHADKGNVSSEGDDDECDEEDEVLSGNFINNGAYTQASPLTPNGSTIKSVARKFKKARSEKEFLRKQNLLNTSFIAGETPSTIDSRGSHDPNQQEITIESHPETDEYALYLQMNRVYDEIYSPSPLIKKGRLHIKPHPDSVSPDAQTVTPDKSDDRLNNSSISCINLMDSSFVTTATESPQVTNKKRNTVEKYPTQDEEDEEWLDADNHQTKKHKKLMKTKEKIPPAKITNSRNAFFDHKSSKLHNNHNKDIPKRGSKATTASKQLNTTSKKVEKTTGKLSYENIYSQDYDEESDEDDDNYDELGSFIQDDDHTPSTHGSSSFHSQSSLDSDDYAEQHEEYIMQSNKKNSQRNDKQEAKKKSNSQTSKLESETSLNHRKEPSGNKPFKRLVKNNNKANRHEDNLMPSTAATDSTIHHKKGAKSGFVDDDEEETFEPTYPKSAVRGTIAKDSRDGKNEIGKRTREDFQSMNEQKKPHANSMTSSRTSSSSLTSMKQSTASASVIVIDESPEIVQRKQISVEQFVAPSHPSHIFTSSKQIPLQSKQQQPITMNGQPSSSLSRSSAPIPFASASTSMSNSKSALGNHSIRGEFTTKSSISTAPSTHRRDQINTLLFGEEPAAGKQNTISVYDLMDDDPLPPQLPPAIVKPYDKNTRTFVPSATVSNVNSTGNKSISSLGMNKPGVDLQRIQRTERVFQQISALMEEEDFMWDDMS